MRKLLTLAAVVALAQWAAPLRATNYVITVGTDDATINGNCTLREALFAATNNGPQDACPAGSAVGADVIVLIGSFSWTLGPFAVFAGEVVVRGAGAPFASLLDLGDHSRFLNVFGGADVTLENLDVKDGNVLADVDTPLGGFVVAFGSALTLRNVNVLSSRAHEGGAVSFVSDGPSLRVEGCRFEGNAAESVGTHTLPRGGALNILLAGTASARLVDTQIVGNEARTTVSGDAAQGGGLYAEVSDDAVLEVRRTVFDGNVAAGGSGGFAGGAGALLFGFEASRVTVSDTTWTDNDLQGAGTFGSGLSFVSSGTATRRLERARFVGNDVGQPPFQLYLETLGGSTLIANDLLVADGGQIGMRGLAGQGSTLRIGHATVVGASTGAVLVREGAGVIRVENSLFWNNSFEDVEDTVPSSLDPSTMTGVDPQFVSPGTGDYRLGAGSPAIDFGNRLLPSAGPYDLAHAPRVVGAQTDAGAFERGGLFGDGLESGDTGAWSDTSP